MISSEKTFDMLPYMANIYEKLDVQNYINTNRVNLSGKTKEQTEELQRQLGIKIIMYVVKNSNKIKEEFFTVISILQEIDMEEAKKQSPIKTINSLKEILNDKEAMGFFKAVM